VSEKDLLHSYANELKSEIGSAPIDSAKMLKMFKDLMKLEDLF